MKTLLIACAVTVALIGTVNASDEVKTLLGKGPPQGDKDSTVNKGAELERPPSLSDNSQTPAKSEQTKKQQPNPTSIMIVSTLMRILA